MKQPKKLNRKEIRRIRKKEKRRFRDYKDKHNLQLPSCQFPNCSEINVETTIPDPNNPTQMNFFCHKHMTQAYNPSQDLPLIADLPDPIDYTELPKQPKKESRSSANRRLREWLDNFSHYIEEPQVCQVCANLDQDTGETTDYKVIPYIPDTNTWYKIVFLCKACIGKKTHKTIASKIQALKPTNLKKLAGESVLHHNKHKTTESLTIKLAELYQTHHNCHLLCSNCNGDLHDNENLTIQKSNCYFPSSHFPLQLYILCPECTQAYSDSIQNKSGIQAYMDWFIEDREGAGERIMKTQKLRDLRDTSDTTPFEFVKEEPIPKEEEKTDA